MFVFKSRPCRDNWRSAQSQQCNVIVERNLGGCVQFVHFTELNARVVLRNCAYQWMNWVLSHPTGGFLHDTVDQDDPTWPLKHGTPEVKINPHVQQAAVAVVGGICPAQTGC